MEEDGGAIVAAAIPFSAILIVDRTGKSSPAATSVVCMPLVWAYNPGGSYGTLIKEEGVDGDRGRLLD